jgi:hypothetical protein
MTLPRRNVERREERDRAVARVVVATPSGLTGAHFPAMLQEARTYFVTLLSHAGASISQIRWKFATQH